MVDVVDSKVNIGVDYPVVEEKKFPWWIILSAIPFVIPLMKNLK